MDRTPSEIALAYLQDTIKEGEIVRLKYLLKYIREDYDNPSCDYLLRQCQTVEDLEKFIRDYPYLFIVENGRVARYTEKLEAGQERVDAYFEEELARYCGPVKVELLQEHIDQAPDIIRDFMRLFYPGRDFSRFVKRRPRLFHLCRHDNTVRLIERECVEFFKGVLSIADGARFSNLTGRIGQAPAHVAAHINDRYPGTELLDFFLSHSDVFRVNSGGYVSLV